MLTLVVAVVRGALIAGGSFHGPVPKSHDVEIIGHDFAFTVPATLPAGATTFRFTNKGAVLHEVAISLLQPGANGAAVAARLNANQPVKPLIESQVGILMARTKHRSSAAIVTDLIAGRDYLVICQFPDSATAQTHARMGMVSVIHVGAGPTPTEAFLVDTIVALDYAFRAPRELSPGLHTFLFVNRGAVDHELNVALLRKHVPLAQVFGIARVDGNLMTLVDEWLGVLVDRPKHTAAGMLQVTLLPNREYVLMCQFTDHENAPNHASLGMLGSIRTRAQ